MSKLLTIVTFACLAATAVSAERPNIIYIMADDLGYGDLGCFGQEVVKTPRIDQMASEGIRMTDHYSGHTVCRPSRLVLLTGKHSGNTAISSNSQYVLPEGAQTVTTLLKNAGYATGGIGKWALGHADSFGAPHRQGFDYWFGYLDQGNAHNYFPEYLWENGRKVSLPGNREGDQKRVSVDRQTWSHDLMTDAALKFIRDNSGGPFFLQAHYTIPHANNEGGRATGDGQEIPTWGQYADREWPTPEKGFAAMVTQLDADVGRILDLLKELNIDDNTIVFFTSDNGPHQEGNHKLEFFDSNGVLRGYKRDLYEGGIRVPMVVRWPGKIKAGATSDHPSAFHDFLATACELAGVKIPDSTDGISYVPAMTGRKQESHRYLYWQFGQKAAVRSDRWKAVLFGHGKGQRIELYDLETDIAEQKDLAKKHPEIAARLQQHASSFAWQQLFDGRSLAGWRGYRQKSAPQSGWDVRNGVLYCDGTARVDLLTEDKFENYELVVEWRTEADGNSGILLHADESTQKLAWNAPEVQIYAVGKRDPGIDHQAGALYALYPAIEESIQPPMTWNTTRVIAQGTRLAVWHNGVRICDARIGSDEWNKKVAAGKFSKRPTFGTRTSGHIGLQDHGKQTWFRSVRLRRIPAHQ